MLSNERIQQFIKAVELDYGKKITVDEATKILEGTIAYLLTLEKIWLRIQNKNNN